MADLKNAEARDADLVALLQVLDDQADEIIEAAGRVLLGHARLLGQLGRDLGQRNSWNRRLAWLRGCSWWHCHDGGVP
jgi:hypothetical protein